MPSFLKDLTIRRRSKLSFHGPESGGSSGNSSNDGDAVDRSRNKSSSTLASWFEKPSPATTLASSRTNKSSSNLPSLTGNDSMDKSLPNRPRLRSSQSNRHSVMSMPTQNGEAVPRMSPATSPYAPRVLSVSDGSWVHQKVLLIFGQCADPQFPIDGSLTIYHHGDNFPPTQWPVCDSHFKALVYLQPGPNRLRFEFVSPKLSSPGGDMQAHSSWMHINFLPLISSPPLQLCILVAKDSAETYDAVPERVQKEGNGLATAIRKFRMAAYLWQAFTAEHMNRNGFGRRCYRYEEEWQPGTLTWKDFELGQMRNEAKIHVVRMDKTVKEIQDLNIAQQHESAKKKGQLFDIAMDAVRAHFGPRPGQVQYVSCMFLDTHWDKKIGTIRGHAALGGGDDTIKLAIFGSHCLQSYPAHIEEVVPAFSDCTRTDTNFVANDCNDAGSNWEAANIGIGAHLHETGHLFGCPHQEHGIMKRDYVQLNRSFICREPYSTRTKQQGQRLCLPKDECKWHRLDALRFRYHPCFQLPNDPAAANLDTSIQVWSVENSSVLVTAATGIAWIEMYPEGDDVCHYWIDNGVETTSAPSMCKQMTLTEKDLKDRLPESKRKKKLKLKVFSCGGSEYTIEDFNKLTGKEGTVKLPDDRLGFRSSKLGFSQMDGSKPIESFLSVCWKQPKILLSVRVYHGTALDGIEFYYEDGHSEMFGKRGGRGSGSVFQLDRKKAETMLGFYVRSGVWIDGIQILTSTGRRSEFFGNATGGSGHTLIPPVGYSIAGIYGSCGAFVDGFGLIITK